ncbi:type-F conjugative transfer system pilin assembly protein TrbC [Denitrovibrio acetiphilus DSM 12809]|uniref:Type-F conjugative transfer system pilin assembly protein TrbC n=1 Tax=Denitrovibrio acetiphilus (strain DSM 12809 / NBRC 114555 / N2460) TaxID=522772 RepID=D4H474_DENA2|nr:type-F conjugative transfer system pilin assembly protein TrbC [Denitrovibrio acetiphilus]ADD67385.1 type-F conjugative transfer system pilin assembly protein TrbC [Denitrovibrio acetiphilus DSM 12809]
MKVILLALFTLCSSFVSAETLKETIDDIKKSAKPDISLPDNQEMREKAKAFIDTGYDALMNKVSEYKKQIAESNGYEIDKDETCHSELPDKSLYIFISSSMPEKTLQNYSATARDLEGSLLVINGVIGSIEQIMPTVDFVARISCGKGLADLTEDTTCDMAKVDINPYLFRAFNIKSVPAFVHSSLPYSEVMQKVTLGEPISEDSYTKIYGDVSVQYALEKFSDSGITVAKTMLQKLKQGFYDK